MRCHAIDSLKNCAPRKPRGKAHFAKLAGPGVMVAAEMPIKARKGRFSRLFVPGARLYIPRIVPILLAGHGLLPGAAAAFPLMQ